MEKTTNGTAMREIRNNPIVPSESVLVATARSKRPRTKEEPAPRGTRRHVPECAFYRGNAAQTPPQTLRAPAVSAEWSIRIVANLYAGTGQRCYPTQAGLWTTSSHCAMAATQSLSTTRSTVLPFMQQPSGFELDSGLCVNTFWPAQAAERLRAVVL